MHTEACGNLPSPQQVRRDSATLRWTVQKLKADLRMARAEAAVAVAASESAIPDFGTNRDRRPS